MRIPVQDLEVGDLKPMVNPKMLGFGKHFSDRMFTMGYAKGAGWNNPEVRKYAPFSMDPAACVLHYSQEIFEGLKAYAAEDGRILLFRPEENARRMNRSAVRMVMPEVPVDDFVQAVTELVLAEKRWIPREPGTSLYIRPTSIATEAFLGVHPASEYLFYVIVGPVGAYYAAGFAPIGLYVEDELARTAGGGTGEAKTGGNYAASLYGQAKAQQKGFAQLLWLDAKEHRYVEEVGAMNMFFVIDGKLVTPALSGSILPGITRASILQLAPTLGVEVEERLLAVDEVVAGLANGTVTEAFGSGTAAVISPVGRLQYKGVDFTVGDGETVGPISQKLYDTLTGIQWGRLPDPFGWVKEIGRF